MPRSALRELAVQRGTAEGEDDADGVLDSQAAALADPAVGEDDDGFHAGGTTLVYGRSIVGQCLLGCNIERESAHTSNNEKLR